MFNLFSKWYLSFAWCLPLLLCSVACGGVKKERNEMYMPDMFPSRAYETFTNTLYLKREGAFFNAMPAQETVARDVDLPLHWSANYDTSLMQAVSMQSPLAPANATDLAEGKRLFYVNCAVCHGEKLDGNGVLYKDGEGPFPARPTTLNEGDAVDITDGAYFHTILRGKNLMGHFEGRLRQDEVWQIVAYIRDVQRKKAGG